MFKKFNSFELEAERQQFKQLLAVNPNYFGNLPLSELPPVLKIVGNTRYEQITGVGYNPDLDLLEAVVSIKMPFGYNGGLGAGGSSQFVRFFVDYGNGWQDAGLASFMAHDIPDETGREHCRTKPLNYALSLEHHLNRNRYSCLETPKVRAILSWEVLPPADADWLPVWGNVIDRHVQITPRPRKLIEFASDMAKTFKTKAVLPEQAEYARNTALDLPAFLPRPIETLAKLYLQQDAEFAVEPHRFAMPDVHATQATSFLGDSAVDEAKVEQYQAVGIDWRSVVSALDKTRGDASYEQLHCVGLDYNREWVVANFTVKRPAGYQGCIPELGSVEHVAFWVDWENNGEWRYLATVGVAVHDLSAIPVDGLNFWVGVPARLAEHRPSGKQSPVGRLRAVLSWHARPSDTDPNAIPHWGNSLDTYFEIKDGRILSEHPAIDAVGGVSVNAIDGDGMTVPNAVFAQTGAPADPWVRSRQCAFGGDIHVNAEVPVSFSLAAYKYRLLVRKVGSIGNGEPVMSPFVVTRCLALGGGTVLISPELGSGWVSYLHPDQNLYSVLGSWQSADLDPSERNKLWEIKLELANSALKILGSTGWHRIRLDNKAPVAAIDIDGGAIPDCSDINRGCLVNGHFVAYDPSGHFGAWALDMTPTNSQLRPLASQTLPSSSPTGFTPGHDWQLDTVCNSAANPLQSCECRVTVSVWANTIVHSSQFARHHAEDDAFFCLRANSRKVAEPSHAVAGQTLPSERYAIR
jgi:hypothetical protein